MHMHRLNSVPATFCLLGREGVYRVHPDHTEDDEDGYVRVERRRYRCGGLVWVEAEPVYIENLLDPDRGDGWHPIPPGPDTFVNVYEVTRHFGGREEGGWWYDRGNPLASVPVLPGQDPEILVATLSDAFSDQAHGNIQSVRGGVEISVVVEDHFATPWPEYRPHFE